MLSLLRRDWTAVRIENRGRGFLLQAVSQFAAGKMFQLFSLAVNSIDGHAAFRNQILFPQPMRPYQFGSKTATGIGQLIAVLCGDDVAFS